VKKAGRKDGRRPFQKGEIFTATQGKAFTRRGKRRFGKVSTNLERDGLNASSFDPEIFGERRAGFMGGGIESKRAWSIAEGTWFTVIHHHINKVRQIRIAGYDRDRRTPSRQNKKDQEEGVAPIEGGLWRGPFSPAALSEGRMKGGPHNETS